MGTAELYGALLQHELAFPERSVGERVREIGRSVGQVFAAEADVLSIAITRSNLFFGSTGEKAERDLGNYDRFAELFRQGQESGEIRSDVGPHQLAEIISATMMITIMNWLVGWWGSRQPDELDVRLMRAADVFLEGCGAPSLRSACWVGTHDGLPGAHEHVLGAHSQASCCRRGSICCLEAKERFSPRRPVPSDSSCWRPSRSPSRWS